MQQSLSPSALPALRRGDCGGKLENVWVFIALPVLPGEFSCISETPSISAALREKKGSLARCKNFSWLSAERGQLVCPSDFFLAVLSLFFMRWRVIIL